MRAGVVTFPGANCDRDLRTALARVTGAEVVPIWHGETELPPLDLIGVPGGFTFGDYLRVGAIAARSAVMGAVAEAAARGVPVLGVCNGFQILCEAGLLPGALVRNRGLTFVCDTAPLVVANAGTVFTRAYRPNERIALPIAHHDGRYVADEATLDRLEGEGRVAFRYADDPNGSARAIAGIVNAAGNVLGLMPHPERAAEPAHGNTDGARLFQGLVEAVA